MKKILALLLSALMVVSLASCGGAPSDAKIKAALEEGTITIEDAKAKGWIDAAWIEEHFPPIEAGTKIYLFDAFQTTYLDGSPASSELIAGNMCLVFFRTDGDQAMEKLAVYEEIAAELEEMGVPVLGILMDSDSAAAKQTLTDMPFPIICYNDQMHASLADYEEMLDHAVVSVFTKEGGFYSAWNSQPNADELLAFARSLVDET